MLCRETHEMRGELDAHDHCLATLQSSSASAHARLDKIGVELNVQTKERDVLPIEHTVITHPC